MPPRTTKGTGPTSTAPHKRSATDEEDQQSPVPPSKKAANDGPAAVAATRNDKALEKMMIALAGVINCYKEMALESEGPTKVFIAQAVTDLQTMLDHTKEKKLRCSSLTNDDLQNLGVVPIQDELVFTPDAKLQLSNRLTTHPLYNETEHDLIVRLWDIINHFHSAYEASSRVVVDAFLLSIGKLREAQENELHVLILPEIQLGSVSIQKPNGVFTLTGVTDYGVLQFVTPDDEAGRSDFKNLMTADSGQVFLRDRLPTACVVIELKRNSKELRGAASQAVGEALMLADQRRLTVVRFILSNGKAWIFGILRKKLNGDGWGYQLTSLQATSVERLELRRRPEFNPPYSDIVRDVQAQIRAVLSRLYEWLSPRLGDSAFEAEVLSNEYETEFPRNI